MGRGIGVEESSVKEMSVRELTGTHCNQIEIFKTPNGIVSETRPWPYNRGNTVISELAEHFFFLQLMSSAGMTQHIEFH